MKILSNLFNNNVKTDMVKQTNKTDGSPEKVKGQSSVFDALEIEKTPENQKIINTLNKNNIEPTNEMMKDINTFIDKTEGSFESKLNTIDQLASKGIEMTEKNLTSVHEAMNGEIAIADDMVKELIESDSKEVVAKLRKLGVEPKVIAKIKALLDSGDLDKNTFKALVKNLVFSSEGLTKENVLDNMTQEMKDLWQSSLLPTLVDVLDQIEDQTKTIDKEKSQVATDSSQKLKKDPVVVIKSMVDVDSKIMPDASEEDGEKIEENSEVSSLQLSTEDQSIEDQLVDALESLLDQVEESVSEMANYETLALLTQGHDFESKSFLVKEITAKMIDLKAEFKDFRASIQGDLSKTIDDMEVQKKVTVDTKEALYKAIEKTDNMLMKSEIPLYTSIQTEKTLLLMSSDLENAKDFLEQGKYKEALEIVKNVRHTIDKIVFDPSDKKVIAQTAELINQGPEIVLKGNDNVTPRAVLEVLRGMGVNHESEVANKAFSHSDGAKDRINDNAKSILLKMMKEDAGEQKIEATDGKNLNNLTGQQLMNKMDQNSGMQKMLFNIPLKVDEEVKNLKVHVNGKKNNGKMDWKNTSMYFLIDLKKHGETGIRIDAVDGRVKVTVKNDQVDGIDNDASVIQGLAHNLEEIGFKIDSITFEELSEKSSSKEVVSEIKPVITKKTTKTEGFDFKI